MKPISLYGLNVKSLVRDHLLPVSGPIIGPNSSAGGPEFMIKNGTIGAKNDHTSICQETENGLNIESWDGQSYEQTLYHEVSNAN